MEIWTEIETEILTEALTQILTEILAEILTQTLSEARLHHYRSSLGPGVDHLEAATVVVLFHLKKRHHEA